jgi:hypothetical protein
MKNVLRLIGVIAIAAVIGFSMTACPEPEPEPDPTPQFTALQVYILENGVFTLFPGTGSEMDVTGLLLGIDSQNEKSSIGKIGTVSKDGKLSFELPSSIADDKLFLVPNEFGGDGKTKFGMVGFVVSDDNYSKLELFNSSNSSYYVQFIYTNSSITANGKSFKKGWNYLEGNDQDGDAILDISSHKWVIN